MLENVVVFTGSLLSYSERIAYHKAIDVLVKAKILIIQNDSGTLASTFNGDAETCCSRTIVDLASNRIL